MSSRQPRYISSHRSGKWKGLGRHLHSTPWRASHSNFQSGCGFSVGRNPIVRCLTFRKGIKEVAETDAGIQANKKTHDNVQEGSSYLYFSSEYVFPGSLRETPHPSMTVCIHGLNTLLLFVPRFSSNLSN